MLGLGPIGEMCTSLAQRRGAGRVLAVDLVPERLERARGHGIEALAPTEYDGELAAAVGERTDGRGPISVIDAIGMEAHGAPIRQARPPPGRTPSRRADPPDDETWASIA